LGDHIKKDEMDGTCSTHARDVNSHKILVGKPEEKRPLGRNGRKSVPNTEVDLKEIGCEVRTGFKRLSPIKTGNFLDQMSDYHFKDGFTPSS
jgi:hypothetical protein